MSPGIGADVVSVQHMLENFDADVQPLYMPVTEKTEIRGRHREGGHR